MTFHYTPTQASWLNQVEGWFSILQGQSLAGASFSSVEQLKQHIKAFIETYNESPNRLRGPNPKSTSAASKGAVSATCDSGY